MRKEVLTKLENLVKNKTNKLKEIKNWQKTNTENMKTDKNSCDKHPIPLPLQKQNKKCKNK